jgi:hypothetical protein
MYINGKMRPIETVPGMVGGGIKENGEGMNSSMMYLIYFKNICRCHNVPQPSTTIKKKKVPRVYCMYNPTTTIPTPRTSLSQSA